MAKESDKQREVTGGRVKVIVSKLWYLIQFQLVYNYEKAWFGK